MPQHRKAMCVRKRYSNTDVTESQSIFYPSDAAVTTEFPAHTPTFLVAVDDLFMVVLLR